MSRQDSRVPSIVLTHDGKLSTFWSESKRVYAGTRVIFVTRDPRDAVVSHFHHCPHRDGVFRGQISEFIRDKYYGLEAVVEYMNTWWHAREQPQAFHLCRYEDFLASPEAEFLAILDFLNERNVDEDDLGKALERGSFENMRQSEGSATANVCGLTQTAQTRDSRKVRKGKAGGYREELSAHDVRYVDEIIGAKLHRAFGYC
jgi:Sulfotransferase domain